MKKVLCILGACLAAGGAGAKLPPLSEEAKLKADAAKAKAAWGDKVAAYKLCLAQDKVAALYWKGKGGAVQPVAATPPCQDPGGYVETAPAASAASVGVAGAKK